MIDPVQLPLLLKAIDFVFEEGHKILEERRERRKMQDARRETEDSEPVKETQPEENEGPEPGDELVLPESVEKNETKQELLASKVDELMWQNHQKEIQHLVKLLETYSRNYYLAREQHAQWGNALVPPIIVHNMQDAENSIVETIKRLELVLSKVYKKDINLTK